MQNASQFEVGLIQRLTRKGVVKTLRILQVFSGLKKNRFKTQMASKEIWSEEFGIDLDHTLEYQKNPSGKELMPLLFSATNKNVDTKATKIGAAIFLDTSRYPQIRTWNVEFFEGENRQNGKTQILISKTIRNTYGKADMKPGMRTTFDALEDYRREDLNLENIGIEHILSEKRKNYLLFKTQEQLEAEALAAEEEAAEARKAAEERRKEKEWKEQLKTENLLRHPKLSTVIEKSVFHTGAPAPLDKQTFYTEYSICENTGEYTKVREFRSDYSAMVEYRRDQVKKILLAESIVEEQEAEAASETPTVIAPTVIVPKGIVEEVFEIMGIKPHGCRIAIANFLYEKVYVSEDNSVTRPVIIEFMLQNHSWSRSTIYRHLNKLEREGFIEDLEDGQNTIQEFRVVGFNARFEKQIRELCKKRGWKFGGKLTGS